MDELEKLLCGWHGSIHLCPKQKFPFRCSLMRKDGLWFESMGMTLKDAVIQAIGEATEKEKL